MANLQERLDSVVNKAETDSELWHTIVHGNDTTEVGTENGNVPTVAKQLKDIRDSITGGVSDVVADAEAARDETITIKEQTLDVFNNTQELKNETLAFRNETEAFKNSAQNSFNNLSEAMDVAVNTVVLTGENQVLQVQNSCTTEIQKVQAKGQEQISLAAQEAERALYYAKSSAPTPLGSKLTVPASSKVPDGYEPVWYKNTITRVRYPDFFVQLVDTNSLILIDEEAYDSQISAYGMCASYVKTDDDTIILPLLINFGRGGTVTQLGGVELDQFQGHFHSSQIRQDQYGAGDGCTISATAGADEGLRKDGSDLFILEAKADGINGIPRTGDETRPKNYYELTYIKCADVTRPLTMEETSEIRNEFVQKTEQMLSFLQGVVQIIEEQRGITGYIKYSDGRFEQWGRAYHDNGSWVTTLFPIAFANDEINMTLTCVTQSSLGSGGPTMQLRYDVNKTRFIWHIPGGYNWNANWRAYGVWK